MSRTRQPLVAILAVSLLAGASCRDATAPQNDDDPITDHWSLSARFTSYTHDAGVQLNGYPGHYAVTDSIPGMTLSGTLTIGNHDVQRSDSTRYTQVSGNVVTQECVVADAAGSCVELGPESALLVPSGSVIAHASFPAEGSINGDLEVRLSSGLTWTGIYLRNVTFAGDSLTGAIFLAEYRDWRAVQPSYNGTFVAHRRR